MRQILKEEATRIGFAMGFAYAIQAIAAHGAQELERQMAQDEQLIGVVLQRETFRRQWKKGYHSWHVQQIAHCFLESKFPDQTLVHIKNWQQGNDEHDPWVCDFVRGDAVSRQAVSCIVIVGWIKEVEGVPVNWWMISPREGERFFTVDNGSQRVYRPSS